MDASELLLSKYLVEAPGLLRVTMEHATRLFAYKENPDEFEKNNHQVFHVLSRAKSASVVLKRIGTEAAVLYSFYVNIRYLEKEVDGLRKQLKEKQGKE